MTHPIEIKSIGFLIDEWITAQFKVSAGAMDARERRDNLHEAIDARLSDIDWQSDDDVLKLRGVSNKCWYAQEKIMEADMSDWRSFCGVARAARIAQKTNGQRNVLIKKLDRRFGDKGISPLEKTYA